MVDPELAKHLHGPVSQAVLPLLAMAIPSVISGLGALFGMKKKKAPQPTATSSAMESLLNQQQQQMQQESPLRRLLLTQSAGLLPTYMKQDPNFSQWMQNSAPGAQAAMNAAARPRPTPYDA